MLTAKDQAAHQVSKLQLALDAQQAAVAQHEQHQQQVLTAKDQAVDQVTKLQQALQAEQKAAAQREQQLTLQLQEALAAEEEALQQHQNSLAELQRKHEEALIAKDQTLQHQKTSLAELQQGFENEQRTAAEREKQLALQLQEATGANEQTAHELAKLQQAAEKSNRDAAEHRVMQQQHEEALAAKDQLAQQLAADLNSSRETYWRWVHCC